MIKSYLKSFKKKKSYSKSFTINNDKYNIETSSDTEDILVEEIASFVEKELTTKITRGQKVEGTLLFFRGIPFFVEKVGVDFEINSLTTDLSISFDDLVSDKGVNGLIESIKEKESLIQSLGIVGDLEVLNFNKDIRIHKDFKKDISLGKSFYLKNKKGRTNNFEELNRYIVPIDWDFDINDLIPISVEYLFMHFKKATYLLDLPKEYFVEIHTSSKIPFEESIVLSEDKTSQFKEFKVYDEI